MDERTRVRTGQTGAVSREVFRVRFHERFSDPAFQAEGEALRRLEAIAWHAYTENHKAPVTRKAGPDYADPDYDLSEEWRATADRLQQAQTRWKDPATPTRALVICGSPRNDGSCPGEMSKSYRLSSMVRDRLVNAGIAVDTLDLSLLTSDPLHQIHPCKACVSTAMPLCHWPCSCYPNHATGQINDWMAEIYEKWVSAHAIVIVTPVHWYQTPSVLKLMIDRLVCADGGNPDPTSTHGKSAAEAKAIELEGWSYPQHLADRVYGLVVHGDVAGIEGTRRALSDWLDWMGLIDAGKAGRLDRFIGYYEPYATSHDALDRDQAVQQEVCEVSDAVTNVTAALRAGSLRNLQRQPRGPRPK